jgi:hypothetical protein
VRQLERIIPATSTRRAALSYLAGAVLGTLVPGGYLLAARDLSSEVAARKLVDACQLTTTLQKLAARTVDSRPLRELLAAASGLSPAAIIAASSAGLRTHLRARIVEDYRQDRLACRDGWLLSATESDSIALASRVVALQQVS